MSSQHRKTTAQPRRWGTRHTVVAAAAGAVIGASGYTAIAFGLTAGNEPTPVPAATATVNETGRVLAISDTSMTAQRFDGAVRTYQLTPNTASFTAAGGRSGTASEEFAVNEVVTVVANVSHGTATATAVADHSVTGPDGPPMETSIP